MCSVSVSFFVNFKVCSVFISVNLFANIGHYKSSSGLKERIMYLETVIELEFYTYRYNKIPVTDNVLTP